MLPRTQHNLHFSSETNEGENKHAVHILNNVVSLKLNSAPFVTSLSSIAMIDEKRCDLFILFIYNFLSFQKRAHQKHLSTAGSEIVQLSCTGAQRHMQGSL